MNIELAQLALAEGDIEHNLARALDCVYRSDAATELIIFPELQLSGFPEPGHVIDRALTLDGSEITALHHAAREKDVAIAIGLIERDGERFYNTTVLITPERGVALRYRKTHLWPDERGLVTPGDRLVTCEWRGIRVGLLVCYDIEFPETARALAALGAELLIVTNGNMDPYGPVHRTAALARATENQLFLAMTNRAGAGAGLTFAGESAIVDPLGRLVAACGRDEQTLRATLELKLLAQARRDYRYLADRRLPLAGRRVDCADGGREWHLP